MTKYDKELELTLIEEIANDKRFFSWSKLLKIMALENLLAGR
jgi:hypothetical protein